MNQIKQSIRQIKNRPTFFVINLAGLVVGLSSFLILFLYILNEQSFDKHLADHERIYRVHSVPEGRDQVWARSLAMVKTTTVNNPDIELASQFSHCPVGEIQIKDIAYQQKDLLSVDIQFFEMFDIMMKTGLLEDILKPNTLFISESFAKKYFKNQNPVGQHITIDALQYARNLGEYEIRGIVKDAHPKSHFNYELLLSQHGALADRFKHANNSKISWTYNYVKLAPQAQTTKICNDLETGFNNSNLKQIRGPKEYSFSLMPISYIHTESQCRFELKQTSPVANGRFFLFISAVVLLVSLLNFVNLTIAQLLKRNKEFGLKKTIGAKQSTLVGQILAETFVVSAVSIIISMVLISVLSPFIRQYLDIDFQIYFTETPVYLTIVGILLISALFIGGFTFLSLKNNTVNILKNNTLFNQKFVFRNLLIFQFSVVILLTTSTLLVNKQLKYISQKTLGYDKENVVVFHQKDRSLNSALFVEEIKKLPQVMSAGMTAQHFGYPAQQLPLEDMGIDGAAEFVFANYDYLETMNIQLSLDRINHSADTITGMVINQNLYNRLMQRHGSLENLEIYLNNQSLASDQTRIKLVGVMEDFNFESMHHSIGDFAFYLGESDFRSRFIHVKLAEGNLAESMKRLNTIWKQCFNTKPSTFFIDEKVNQQYKAEIILSRILMLFSIIGIIISCVGISAIALFIAQQKTKEIGIKKVNGATVTEILASLNFRFIKWVGIASIIGIALSWYFMHNWLENFAYKTTLSWWIFALSGVLALGIALLTVSWQSWRAATRNPVEALRYE